MQHQQGLGVRIRFRNRFALRGSTDLEGDTTLWDLESNNLGWNLLLDYYLKQLLKLSFSISKYKRMLHGGEIKYCMWGKKKE